MRNTVVWTLALGLMAGLGGIASAQAPLPVQLHGAVARSGKSYVEQKSDQVFAAFLTFEPARTVEEQQDRLGWARDRDALLVAGGAPSSQASAIGAMMMGATVVLAAHAPARLRPLVDGVVHVGPAVFDGGGMGAGVGARF
jgi:hypothetical protein